MKNNRTKTILAFVLASCFSFQAVSFAEGVEPVNDNVTEEQKVIEIDNTTEEEVFEAEEAELDILPLEAPASPYTYAVISEEEKTIRITGFKSGTLSGAVEIPEEIDGYTVISLGNATFGYNNTGITSIKVPDTVRRIEDVNCFYQCKNVTEIILPDEMDYIGTGAFSGCSSLKSIVIPKGVTKLEKMFRGCTSLKNITLPASVSMIDSYSFASTIGGTDIMKGITIKCAMGSYAEQFAKSKGINVKYSEGPLFTFSDNGDGTITITDMADDVEIVGTLEIPDIYEGVSVTGIGDGAFRNRTDITSITLPSSVTSIGKEAFAGCSNITIFEVPEGVTELNDTFIGCTALKTVTIPASVTSISDEAFYAEKGGSPIKRLYIYCKKGSAAETYAKANNISYEAEGALPDAWDGSVDTAWYDDHKDEETFYISTAAELAGLRRLVNSGTELFYGKTVILEDDINMEGTVWRVGIGYYTADSEDERAFNGVFDGGKHVISNFTYNSNANTDTDSEVVIPLPDKHLAHGLFGVLGMGAEVKNLGLEKVSVTAGNTDYKVGISVGGMVGRNKGVIEHCYVSDVKLAGGYYGSFCSQNYAGFCAASANKIEDCFVKDIDFTGVVAQINASQKGGLTVSNSGTIKNCYVANPIYSDAQGYYTWNADGSGKDKCPIMFTYDPITCGNSGTVENVYSTDAYCRNQWDVGKRAYKDFNLTTEKMNNSFKKLTFNTIAHGKIVFAVKKTDGDKTGISPEVTLEFTQSANMASITNDTVALMLGDNKINSFTVKDSDSDDYPYECTIKFDEDLDWENEYTIVADGVKDFWNREIAAESVTFMTTGEIVFEAFELYENYGLSGERKITSTDGITGPVTAVIKGLKNNGTNKYADAVISIAILVDDQIVKGATETISIGANETKSGTLKVTSPYITQGASGEVFIQAVLYKSKNNVVPLMRSVQIGK